jgi:hypothetical protein
MENQNKETSPSAIACWVLAGISLLISLIIIFGAREESFYHTRWDKVQLAIGFSCIISGVSFIWMGNVVNYLKQIANK